MLVGNWFYEIRACLVYVNMDNESILLIATDFGSSNTKKVIKNFFVLIHVGYNMHRVLNKKITTNKVDEK